MSTLSIALIIGGSSGMGKETAKRLLQSGVVVKILSHDDEKLNAAKRDLAASVRQKILLTRSSSCYQTKQAGSPVPCSMWMAVSWQDVTNHFCRHKSPSHHATHGSYAHHFYRPKNLYASQRS